MPAFAKGMCQIVVGMLHACPWLEEESQGLRALSSLSLGQAFLRELERGPFNRPTASEFSGLRCNSEVGPPELALYVTVRHVGQ